MASTLVVAAGWLAVSAGLTVVVGSVMAVAAAAGLIGLADDLSKLAKKANAGISAPVRLAAETLLGLALGAIIFFVSRDTSILTSGGQSVVHSLSLPLAAFVALAAFYMAATTNALNLHDGMDGLAAGTSLVVFTTLAFMLYLTGHLSLAAVAAAAAGSIAGFLIYNRYKAAIFMGDCGSLFIGGLMAALVIAGKLELWFIPLALIYILETLSVMIQVVYFKLTKDYSGETPTATAKLVWLKLTKRLPGQGKRFFRMAPLHHHFEAVGSDRGFKEWEVVVCFWLAQLAVALVVFLIFMSV